MDHLDAWEAASQVRCVFLALDGDHSGAELLHLLRETLDAAAGGEPHHVELVPDGG